MLHSDIAAGEIHGVPNWIVADIAARDVLTVTAADLYKACWVISTGVLYILTGTGPTVWSTVGSTASASNAFSGFRVNKNGVNQAIGASAFVKVTWGAEAFDYGGNFDLANSKALIVADGKWEFGCNLGTTSGPNNSWGRTILYKNGAPFQTLGIAQTNGTGGAAMYGGTSGVIDVVAGDYFEIYAFTGVAHTLESASTFTLFWGNKVA